MKLVKTAGSASPAKRLDMLLDSRDPKMAVQSLPVLDFVYMAMVLGPADSVELLSLASKRQLNALIDADTWDRDRIDLHRVLKWLEPLGDAGQVGLAKGFLSLDPEVAGLMLLRWVKVYLEGEDQDPGEGRILHPTPDPRVYVEIMLEGEEAERILKLLDQMYSLNPAAAVRLLLSVRSALPSELEETAYKWRNARMEELGFPPFEEALDVYSKPVPDHEARLPYEPVENLDISYLPELYQDRLDPDELLGAALELMDELQRKSVTQQLMSLFNRVLVADRIGLRDLDAVKRKVGDTCDTLVLGLEVLGARDPAGAARTMYVKGVKNVFQYGYKQGADLAARVRKLVKAGMLAGDPPGEQLDSPAREAVAALLLPRPRFSRLLDDPPFTGTRPFKTLEDVSTVEEIVDEVEAAALVVYRVIGFSRKALDTLARQTDKAPTLANAFRTAVVRRAMGADTFDIDIVGESELERFRRSCIRIDSKGKAELIYALKTEIDDGIEEVATALPAKLRSKARRVLNRWTKELVDEVGNVSLGENVDPRFIGCVFASKEQP